jgi:kinesin family protein 18/19
MAEIEEKGILVAVRIRPLSKKELSSGNESCCQTLGDKNIAIRKGGNAKVHLKSQQSILNEYAFDAVFDDKNTQEDVYVNTAKKYIPNFVSGKNVTVFAYGATGAGKTHTMLGNSRVDSNAKDAGPGIIPCAMRDIFEQISHREQLQADHTIAESWAITLGYIEVYNEQVYDLLGGSGKVLAVREDQERGIVVVAGMQEQLVKNYDEVTEYMMQGNRNRKTEATMANAVSSRSHAVLQLTLRRTMLRLDTNKETVIESKLSLIDLAGSERASATNNCGVRLQEGANINRSLLALANCINALSEKKEANVRYRDSKLTHLLKSSLEGNCNLIMIANINPSDTTYEDSNNTLKYANRAKNIKVNPTVQETAKDTTWLERELRLRGENAALRAKVADLTKLLNEAQEFRNEIISLCARGTSVESKFDISFARASAYMFFVTLYHQLSRRAAVRGGEGIFRRVFGVGQVHLRGGERHELQRRRHFKR